MSPRRPAAPTSRPPPTVNNLSPNEIAIAVAGVVAVTGYTAFILAPAWTSYGRFWEKLAASLLTLFMLATLLGLGAAIGLAIVWSYDRFA